MQAQAAKAKLAKPPRLARAVCLSPCRHSKAKSEKEMERKGRRWLLCAAAAIAAYVFFSGQYIDFDLLPGYEMEGEEEEE